MAYGWPVKVFLPVMYLLVFMTGLIGNVCILLLITTRRKMHTVTNIFIGLLATGDLMIVLFCMPFSVPSLYIYEKWTLGLTACRVILVLQTTSAFLSALTLTAMSVERYFVLVHPMKAMTAWTQKTAIYCSISIVLISMLCASPFSLLTELAPVDPSNQNNTDVLCLAIGPQPLILTLTVFRLTLTYVIPLAIMGVLYGLTIRQLTGSSLKGSQPERIVTSRKKVVHMLIILVVVFAICWLPSWVQYMILAIDANLLLMDDGLAKYMPVTTFLVYFNCIMNPFLYSFMSSQYRNGFKAMFAQCCCGRMRHARTQFSNTSGSDTTGKVSTEVKSLDK
ncbi:hypothetical protein CAPTEDRAFT_201805 [Capitella teleta]|uniref:G-protein coupled receptors family 1 profile domain-containing protein n=1 Tax=Capitella teleta TaxID=283909 RepID=R7U5A1_CAPTE|nr:hypothetical protein CAPTEDRAFT_201805 [Capitella teleta]|eukprot:ELU01545.1 hypothetical protein CAPTEDRAFT_201805 [Capitella teleta]